MSISILEAVAEAAEEVVHAVFLGEVVVITVSASLVDTYAGAGGDKFDRNVDHECPARDDRDLVVKRGVNIRLALFVDVSEYHERESGNKNENACRYYDRRDHREVKSHQKQS